MSQRNSGEVRQTFDQYMTPAWAVEALLKKERIGWWAWDAASTRQDILEYFPGFLAKYTLARRIRWENLPQKEAGPTMNHAWFVWDWFRKGRDIGWVS